MDFEIAKPDGTMVESVKFDTPEQLRAYKKQKYGDRPLIFRPAPSAANQRVLFGAAEGLTGPAQLAYMGAKSVAGALKPRPGQGGGATAGLREGFGQSLEGIQGARETVARGLGMAGAPDPAEADIATSVGRVAGGALYGPKNWLNALGNATGEATDYAIQKSGGGALARFLGSMAGDVGAQQFTSGANRAAVKAGAEAVANRRALKAYDKLSTLDIVDDDFASALATGKSRAQRMLKFNNEAWEKFDFATKSGMNKGSTGFKPGGVIMVDAKDLIKQANYVWTSTAPEYRDNLPKVIKTLVERGKRPAPGSMGELIPLTDLRTFHKDINDLWKEASHRNASPVAEAMAAKADELRGPINAIYENLLNPVPASRSNPNVQRGPTMSVVSPPIREEVLTSTPGSEGSYRTVNTSKGPGHNPNFPRVNPPPPKTPFVQTAGPTYESRFTPGREGAISNEGSLLTRDPMRPIENMTEITPLNRDQAGALAAALESSRQLGSELDNLKKSGIDLASGIGLEPQKLLTNILGGNSRTDAPEIAKDFYAIVSRESGDKVAGQQLGQAWMDFVVGPGAEFRVDGALKRLRQSAEVGKIWAGPDRVKNLESIIRTLKDPGAPPGMRNYAQSTLSFALGAGGGALLGGGQDLSHTAAMVAGGAALGAVPHVFIYMRDRFGRDATTRFAREMLMDKSLYQRMRSISSKKPTLKDFEWVDANVKALLLRQSGRGARQLQTGEQQ